MTREVVNIQDYQVTKGEDNFGPTQTKPNESYTIRELVNRMRKGQFVGEIIDGVYVENMTHDDVDLGKLKNLDLAELDEFASYAGQRVQELKAKIEEKNQSEAEAERKTSEESEEQPQITQE